METQLQTVLQFFRGQPASWFRPGNNLRLLVCLSLAIRGDVIAQEDEMGFRFRLLEPIRLSA